MASSLRRTAPLAVRRKQPPAATEVQVAIEAYERHGRIERVESGEGSENDLLTVAVAEGSAKTVGLFVVERGGAVLGLVENDDDVRVVESFDSDVMGKTETGGQSADRFFAPLHESSDTDEGGDCLVVPTDFGRDEQFDEAFGGVAALRRFLIE